MTNNISSIAIFTHTQYKDDVPIYGPADNIKDYLRKYFNGNIYYLQHSLYKGNGTVLTLCKNGEEEELTHYCFHRKFISIFRYLTDCFLTVQMFLQKEKVPLVIAVDPLNFLYALFLNKINKADKIIFYTLDYAYKRFDNPVMNWAYHVLDRFAVRHCYQSWSAAKKIALVRSNQGIDGTRNIYVPNSPIFQNVRIKSIEEIDRFSLVSVFSNHAQVDFNIMFDAMAVLFQKFPQIKLKLIGRGDFKKHLEPLIIGRDYFESVSFLDIHSHSTTLDEISKCAIGLECNTQTLYWNEFREPIKIREYIAFGLPVISKPGHALVEEIREEGIGSIVHSSDDLIRSVESYFNNFEYYSKIRSKVLDLGKRYDKKMVLDNILSDFMKGDLG